MQIYSYEFIDAIEAHFTYGTYSERQEKQIEEGSSAKKKSGVVEYFRINDVNLIKAWNRRDDQGASAPGSMEDSDG